MGNQGEQNIPSHAARMEPTAEEPEEVLEYWTEERMKEAVPLPRPKPLWDPSERREELTPDGRPIAEPMVFPPQVPTAPEITGTKVGNPNAWPYACVGKLFMTFGGKPSYYASGFSVSGSKSVFMTAGHCVYDQDIGKWASKIMIALSYSSTSGGAQFAAVKLVTLWGWIRKEGDQYDIGAGVVNGDMFTGRGNLGIKFNQPANTGPWTAIGYPANSPYPGNTMYQSVGSYIGPDGTGTIGMNNNDMGGGSSGGSWLVNSDWGYVNGLQSFDYNNPDTDEYSPYFGTAAYNVWLCAVANQGCS